MSYIPLMTLVLTVAGTAVAVAQIEGVYPTVINVTARPAVIAHRPLQRRRGHTLYGYRPVSTLDAGPDLFPDLCLPAWRANMAPFPPPPPFAQQEIAA